MTESEPRAGSPAETPEGPPRGSSGPQRCAGCGALPSGSRARFCEYCGTELPRPAGAPPPPASPFGDVEARFRALAADPTRAQWMARTPEAPSLARQTALSVIGLLFLSAIGLVGTVAMFAACPPLGLIPIAVVGVAAYALVQQIGKTSEATRAPLRRLPALVIDERTKISGGGGQSSAHTRYFATLEFEDGERREVDVLEPVVGAITPGDMGIAFLKGDFLIDFGRIRV